MPDQLDHTPADTLTMELRDRLIHIEAKVDHLMRGRQTEARAAFNGHADQAFGHLTYAQFGEDLIVANLFARLGIGKPSYLDVGAHHPFNVSNTALLYAAGSRGVNVEANPNLIAAFRRERPDDVTVNVGVGPSPGEMPFYYIDDFSGRNTFSRAAAEAFVRENPAFSIAKVEPIPVVTLDEIVREHCGGTFPNFLSLDVEGLDFDILESCGFDGRGPDVLCVEAVSGDDGDDSMRLRALLRDRGFILRFRTAGNLVLTADRHGKRLDG